MPVQLVAIDDFLIDCSLSESHTFNSDVTEYPVESGSNISDNIRPLPIEVEMECLVSNTPIHVDAIRARQLQRRVEGDTSFNLPSVDAYNLMQTIRDQRKTVTIRTSLRTYEKMALKSLSIPRGNHMDELRFTATFIQIQDVENKRVIRTATPGGNKKKRVSKPLNDSAASQILIDTVFHTWFDPDIGLWRKSYIFAKWVDHETSNFVSAEKYKFNLFRNKILPANHKVSGHRSPFIMLVPIQDCQLHDFSIKTPFSGTVRPFETQRSLSGRSQ